MLTYGELKILGYQPIGGLGPARGTAATVVWQLTDSLVRVIPWAVVLTLLLLSPNRTPRAWLILIPLGAAYGLVWVARVTLSSFLGGIVSNLLDMAEPLCPALAVLWLQSYVFAGYRHWRCLLTALFLLAGMGFLIYAARNGLEFIATDDLFSCGAGAVTTVATLTFSGLWWRRRRRGGWRFAVALLVSSGVSGVVVVLLTVFVYSALEGYWGEVVNMFTDILQFGGFFGFLVALVAAPFLVLTFVSGFYRTRFAATFPPRATRISSVSRGDFA